MRECTYCGLDVDAHDPICLRDCDEHCSQLGRFCNFGCLQAHIEENDLTTGSCCSWQPSEAT
jgi:hypothetical protein